MLIAKTKTHIEGWVFRKCLFFISAAQMQEEILTLLLRWEEKKSDGSVRQAL